MAEQTQISWADATFNPWMGCERVSPACARCYAATLTKNRMGLDVFGGADTERRITSASTWKNPERWNRQAEALGERRRVFCASLADVFEDRADLEEPRNRLFELIVRTPSLDWLLLTKRPEFARDWLRAYYETNDEHGRLWASRDFIEWGCLPNVWVGTSIENQRFTWRADILREIPCIVRFVSAEPLIESLSVLKKAKPGHSRLNLEGLDWVIVGGESGAKAARPMHPHWPEELRDRCRANGIAFHFKQWGSWGPAPVTDGVRPGDVCMSPSGYIDRADDRYVCFANETDGSHLRFYGIRPDAAGNLLEGEVCDDVPTPWTVAA